MVRARQEFLNAGYYQPLCRALCMALIRLCASQKGQCIHVLDAGCGEGYYTTQIAQALWQADIMAEISGVDISKFALDKAARKNSQITYAVASIFHLPVADQSLDLLLNLFAPYCNEEFARVLRPGGLMALVIPGEAHLWELKQTVYDQPYRNTVKGYELDGFTLQEKQEVSTVIHLRSQKDIDNLFKMTPYYYKTSEQGYRRISQLDTLDTQIQFESLFYRKNINNPEPFQV